MKLIFLKRYNNNILLSSFDGIYTLSASGELKRIKINEARVIWLPLYDDVGGLILCRPRSLAKIFMLASVSTCVKEGGWTFLGSWYASREGYTTEPVICGSWIVEPVQLKYKKPITEIVVRDLKSGAIITTQKIPDANHMFCINNSKILTDSGMQSYTLPDMKVSEKYPCHKNEPIVSVKTYNNQSICLTSGGYLGVLKKKTNQ